MNIQVRYLRVVALLLGAGLKAGERVKEYSQEKSFRDENDVRHRLGMCLQAIRAIYGDQLREAIRLEEMAAKGPPQENPHTAFVHHPPLRVDDVSKIFGALITQLECVASTFCTIRCQGNNPFLNNASQVDGGVNAALELHRNMLIDYVVGKLHEVGKSVPWYELLTQRLAVAKLLHAEYQDRCLKHRNEGSILQHFQRAAQELGNEVRGLEILVTQTAQFADRESSLDRS
ncbi:MAG: hypothetical protein K2W82_15560 [Candidatus Obscuribacterales bacterium]|nr:hypothetical protein [Candidatus Obscuribacterales bacterium]